MTQDWESLMKRLDAELNEIIKKRSDIDQEFSNIEENSSLITLFQEIGGASNLPEDKTGILILSSCIKSYFLREMTKTEFVKMMTKPSRNTIVAAQMYGELSSGKRNSLT